jgi:formylglycine-generating enzyme required for sulfatase activity
MKSWRTAIIQCLTLAFALGSPALSHAQAQTGGDAAAAKPAEIQIEFVKIQPGVFRMGCSVGDIACDDDEMPAHQVRITKGFEIGKYEVTESQWNTVMKPGTSAKASELPANHVSWDNAQEFLKRLNARDDGFIYRLPTEAEWEYAARAGSAESAPGALDTVCHIDPTSRITHPVGQKQANAWGLYDVHGNVAEWVEDRIGPYTAADATDPKGATRGLERIMRGGSWCFDSKSVRVSFRNSAYPESSDENVGFRVVREPAPKPAK